MPGANTELKNYFSEDDIKSITYFLNANNLKIFQYSLTNKKNLRVMTGTSILDECVFNKKDNTISLLHSSGNAKKIKEGSTINVTNSKIFSKYNNDIMKIANDWALNHKNFEFIKAEYSNGNIYLYYIYTDNNLNIKNKNFINLIKLSKIDNKNKDEIVNLIEDAIEYKLSDIYKNSYSNNNILELFNNLMSKKYRNTIINGKKYKKFLNNHERKLLNKYLDAQPSYSYNNKTNYITITKDKTICIYNPLTNKGDIKDPGNLKEVAKNIQKIKNIYTIIDNLEYIKNFYAKSDILISYISNYNVMALSEHIPINTKITYKKNDFIFYREIKLGFNSNGTTMSIKTMKKIINNIINNFNKKIQKKIDIQLKEREKELDVQKLLGSELIRGIYLIVKSNEYITENMVVTNLRGTKKQTDVKINDVSGVTGYFNNIKPDIIHLYIKKMINAEILKTKNISGTYNDFKILKVNPIDEQILLKGNKTKSRCASLLNSLNNNSKKYFPSNWNDDMWKTYLKWLNKNNKTDNMYIWKNITEIYNYPVPLLLYKNLILNILENAPEEIIMYFSIVELPQEAKFIKSFVKKKNKI